MVHRRGPAPGGMPVPLDRCGGPAATGLEGTDGNVSVSFVLLHLVISRTICYAHICRSEVGEAGEAAHAFRPLL
jgi:hypothetical protein